MIDRMSHESDRLMKVGLKRKTIIWQTGIDDVQNNLIEIGTQDGETAVRDEDDRM